MSRRTLWIRAKNATKANSSSRAWAAASVFTTIPVARREMQRFSGGKIIEDAGESPSPLTDNMRRLTATIVTALQNCEREILRLEQEAQIRADEILAEARQKARRMEAALVRFDDIARSQFVGWAERLERRMSEELGD
jgi:hypothetical protein